MEAQRCFNADAYTATVVMVRRALEGVCSHHNITATNLVSEPFSGSAAAALVTA
ncbi:DUF4145 domain-containing protein [Nonomuraea wenchangensis]